MFSIHYSGVMMFNPVDHPHRRFNPLTGQYVLVSPTGPNALAGPGGEGEPGPKQAHDPDCFLCAGNTRVTGDINPDYRALLSLPTTSPP
jgi:UDPglucose--hexose-1-phosphate uridylyltransferase